MAKFYAGKRIGGVELTLETNLVKKFQTDTLFIQKTDPVISPIVPTSASFPVSETTFEAKIISDRYQTFDKDPVEEITSSPDSTNAAPAKKEPVSNAKKNAQVLGYILILTAIIVVEIGILAFLFSLINNTAAVSLQLAIVWTWASAAILFLVFLLQWMVYGVDDDHNRPGNR
ncbi:MAG TPA: hypothetical protein VK177_07575 [Flavobacteriales bacterium]|nr:hypothetical protein [Flavobacteriales bacterium]